MSNKTNEIKDSLERILGLYGRDLVTLYVCSVSSVNESARTFNAKVIHGDADIDIPDVSLSAVPNDGQMLLPAVDSTVLVGVTTQQRAFLLLSSDITKFSVIIDSAQFILESNSMTLLDGSYDGLVKVNPLVTKINALESDLNTLKGLFSAWVVAPGDGGLALKTIAATWAASTITPTAVSDLENQYIKHGAP